MPNYPFTLNQQPQRRPYRIGSQYNRRTPSVKKRAYRFRGVYHPVMQSKKQQRGNKRRSRIIIKHSPEIQPAQRQKCTRSPAARAGNARYIPYGAMNPAYIKQQQTQCKKRDKHRMLYKQPSDFCRLSRPLFFRSLRTEKNSYASLTASSAFPGSNPSTARVRDESNSTPLSRHSTA